MFQWLLVDCRQWRPRSKENVSGYDMILKAFTSFVCGEFGYKKNLFDLSEFNKVHAI